MPDAAYTPYPAYKIVQIQYIATHPVGLISAAHQALPDGGTSALSGLQNHKTLCRIRQNKHAVRMDFKIILLADVRLQTRSVDLQ